MGTKNTTLSIVNTSGLKITSIRVSEVFDFHWSGDSRPDRTFHGASIEHNDARSQRQEINVGAPGLYRMTLTFSDGSEMTFSNHQQDAATKINRVYDAQTSGPSAGRLALFQTSGADANAMYVRTRDEPDNSGWMGELLRRKPSVTMNKLTMPGSHDAGMYTTTGGNVSPEWTQTQSYSLFNQLRAGCRYFDLRVYSRAEGLFIGHFGGMGGCYGAPFYEIIDQVKQFMALPAAASEAVFLKFSHTQQDQGRSPMGQVPIFGDMLTLLSTPIVSAVPEIARQLKVAFGSRLYTTQNQGANLARTLLAELAGKVVVLCDNEFKDHHDVTAGLFPYREHPNNGPGLQVFDRYSESTEFAVMEGDQLAKLSANGRHDQDHLFLLSWTLTGALGNLDVQALTARANPRIPALMRRIVAEGLNRPHIVYWDFVDPFINRCIIELNGAAEAAGASTTGPILQMGQQLLPGQALVSRNGSFKLIYQTDGNLVLYRSNGAVLWASNTAGRPAGRFCMQDDGNIVVYDPGGAPLWAASHNGGKCGPQYRSSILDMQDDGNLVVYASNRAVLWASGTNA